MQLKPRENELKIKLPRKVLTLRYKQATAYECLEFQEKLRGEDFNIVEWLYNFINSHAKRPFWTRKAMNKNDFRHIIAEMDKVARKIIYSRFKGAFDENAKKKNENEEETSEESENLTMNAFIYMIGEVTQIDPLEALKKYTFEQLNELIEGFTFYNNLKTEEGRKANKMKIQAEKYKRIDKNEVREQIKRLEEWQKSKLGGKEGDFTK